MPGLTVKVLVGPPYCEVPWAGLEGKQRGSHRKPRQTLAFSQHCNDVFYCFVSPLSEVGRGGRWAPGSQLAPGRSHGTVTALGRGQQEEPGVSMSQGAATSLEPCCCSGAS